MSSDDYTTKMDEVLSFGECEKKRCTEIGIINDTLVEHTESFTVSLSSLQDRIKADTQAAVINIEDNDSALSFIHAM